MASPGSFLKVNTPSGVNLRSSPSAADESNIMQGIPNGTILAVVGESANGWANVQIQGLTGYVSEQFLIAASPAEAVAPKQIAATSYRITGAGVNVRSGPSLNDGIVTTTGPVGETWTATGNVQNAYSEGKYTNAANEQFRGWIAEQYLGFAQDPAMGGPPRQLPQLPPATPPAVTQVANKPPPPAGQPSGMVLAGGLLALALVIYFMAK